MLQEKQGEILNKVADLLDSGVFQSRLTKTYNLWSDIKQAHKDVESGSLVGKVALTV
jgi:NADPH:quinone reductase-like Zn-dependent oxidoreductase